MHKSMSRVRTDVPPEYKSLPLHTKAIDDRAVTTLFSVYGNIDVAADRALPGMFNASITQRGGGILHLWQHDFESPPIAVVKSFNELTRADLPPDVQAAYPDATGGMEATSEFLDTPRANEVLSALKAGSPLQASFGYDVVRSAFTTENDKKIRNLQEVRLWELSTVLWGANPATVGSKALPTTKELAHVLAELKAPADLWDTISECYDLSGGASAFAGVAYLLSGECDDAAQAAPLIGALRMLLAFLSGELDKVEGGIQAGDGMQLMALPGLTLQLKTLLKMGARHSDADMKLIDSLHSMVVDLGATNCAGAKAAESRAEHDSLTLVREKAKLFFLNA